MDDERAARMVNWGLQTRRGSSGAILLIVCVLVAYAHWRPLAYIETEYLLYLPVVLACMWFGWRGWGIAVLAAAGLIVKAILTPSPVDPLGHSMTCALVLLAVGACLAQLKKRHRIAWGEAARLRGLLAEEGKATDQQGVERRAVDERRFSESLIGSLPGLFYVLNEGKRLVRWNRNLERITGYTAEELTDRPALELIADCDRDLVARSFDDVFTEGGGTLRALLRAKDGRQTTFHFTGRLTVENGVRYIVGNGYDVTECKESQEELERIFDLSPDMICVANLNTAAFTKVNPAWERILGYTQEELLNRSYLEFVHPEDLDKTIALTRDMAEQGVRVVRFENRYRCKDGTYRWLSWTSETLPEQGLAYAMARDITARKRTAEVYRALVDYSAQGLVIFQDERAVFANQAMADICGYPREEILSASMAKIRDFVHPEDRDWVWNRHRKRIGGGVVPRDYTFRVVRRDGQVRSIEISATRIDYQGRPAIHASCADVTERVHAENALRQSEAQNRALLTAIPDLMFRLDNEGVILDYQAVEGQTLYARPETFLGRRATEILPVEVAAPLVRLTQQVIESGEPQLFEYQFTVDGAPRDQECRLVRFERRQVLAIVRDVTERKRGERLTQIVYELAVKLNATGKISDGARLCLNAAIEASNMDSGGLYLLNEGTGALELAVHEGLSEEFVRAVSCMPRAARPNQLAMKGTPFFGNYGQLGIPLSPAQRKEGLEAMGMIPIHHEGRVIACLNVASHSMREVPEWSRLVLDAIAAQIGSTLARLEAEIAVLESEERFRIMFESSPDAIFLADPESERIVDVNPAGMRLLERSRDDIVGLHQTELHAAGHREEARRTFRTRVGKSLNEEISRPLESAVLRSDGREIPVEILARSVQIKGRDVLLGTFRDITKRKEVEAALIASERNYREIFNGTSEATFVHDPVTGAIVDVNRAAVEMFGHAREQLLGMTPGQLGSGQPPYSDRDAHLWMTRAVQEGPQTFEWFGRHKNGKRFWVQVNLKQADIGGQPRVLAAAQDITERKEAESAAQRHRAELTRAWHVNALGEMASGLAHELNQPLCAILNYANASLRLARKRNPNTGALEEAVSEIVGQAERAGAVIKRIRGLVGKREPRCTGLDVRGLLGEAMEMVEKEALRHKVEIVAEIDSSLPQIEADNVEIEQVALNLMRNAIEAMGDRRRGPRTLTIAASQPDAETIEVAVRDTGRGLSSEVREQVFDSFFTTKNQGLGIGLSLSRRIIEAHGGRLWAESDGQSGATFRFTLPCSRSQKWKTRSP